ncbi:MAG: hypothetical protein FWH02_09225 [Oscillospiraceae bacterium]|nr:hypothetical protein [Oscillospiraceae bacterium]
MKKAGKAKVRLAENNTFVFVFSVLTAALIWIIVAMTVGRGGYVQSFSGVPVDITGQTDAFLELGVNPIGTGMDAVSVRVTGDRVAITSQNSLFFTATVRVPDDLLIDGPGTYSLPLVPVNPHYDRALFNEILYEPRTIPVTFDHLVSREFPVTDMINGLGFAAGFIGGEQRITPSEITIRGPQAQVSKVSRAVITAELTEFLTRDHIADYDIVILDEAGEEIDLEASHLTIDYPEARLVIPVLKRTGLGVRVGFHHVPKGFPLGELKHTLSTDFIEVAAPADIADRHSEIMLGHIDLRTVNRESTVFMFPLNVPEGYTRLESVSSVSVRFSSDGWGEVSFTATGIDLLNKPGDRDVRILGGETVYNVRFVGLPEILETMTAEDIIMEVDLSERELPLGESQAVLKISAPGKGLVWATGGDHIIVLQVTEAE